MPSDDHLLSVIRSAALTTIAMQSDQYPKDDLPEIALAGRSNVGKSSFLNALMRRKNLARTSSKPGKTRTLNFYTINDAIRFVDLPGYGYAVASKADKEKWRQAIEMYLQTRTTLRGVLLLVDIRHDPTALDADMIRYLRASGLAHAVVATKADKIARGKWQGQTQKMHRILETDVPIFPFSSEKREPLEPIVEWLEGCGTSHRKA